MSLSILTKQPVADILSAPLAIELSVHNHDHEGLAALTVTDILSAPLAIELSVHDEGLAALTVTDSDILSAPLAIELGVHMKA